MFSTIFSKEDPPEKKSQNQPVYRVAKANDIKQMHKVRLAVNENQLSNPGLISRGDYLEFITQRGKGWVCEIEDDIIAFAVADLKENNIWALFVLPKFQGKGIGKKLHGLMLSWYFSVTDKPAWLSTSPGTKAELFYRKAGWMENGTYGEGEIKFVMTRESYTAKNI